MAPAARGRESRYPAVVEYVSIRKVVEREIPLVRTRADIARIAAGIGLHDLAAEAAWVMTLDAARGIHGVYRVAQGGYHEADVSLPVLFGAVLASGTDRFFVLHNHPSGELAPSEHDVALTKRISSGSDLLDLTFEDHLILTPSGRWLSLRKEGLIR